MSLDKIIEVIAVQAPNVPELVITAEAGEVLINGVRFLPHEARRFAGALSKAAWTARELAEEVITVGC